MSLASVVLHDLMQLVMYTHIETNTIQHTVPRQQTWPNHIIYCGDTYCSWGEGEHYILTSLPSHWSQTCHFLSEPQMRNQGFVTLNYPFNHYSTLTLIALLWCTFYPLGCQYCRGRICEKSSLINKFKMFILDHLKRYFYHWACFPLQISCIEIQIKHAFQSGELEQHTAVLWFCLHSRTIQVRNQPGLLFVKHDFSHKYSWYIVERMKWIISFHSHKITNKQGWYLCNR